MIHNLEANSGATGFLVKGKSGGIYILTNGHVCGLEDHGPLFLDYQGDTYSTHVIKKYTLHDLCIMSAPSKAKDFLKLASKYTLGDTAYVLGHPQLEPLSLAVGELSGPVDVRILVKYNPTPAECSGPTYEYHTDLPLEAIMMGVTSACVRVLESDTSSVIVIGGNSGSPSLDIWGRVIGVAFASNQTNTRSYHVPLASIRDFLESL
jgi:S1-C subfamily serine protease